MKLKKGDNVIVTSGKDRGKQAKILRIMPARPAGGPSLGKIIVEGVNLAKVRERARRAGQKGQTVERTMPIDASNAMFYCSVCKRGVRLGFKLVGGNKVRICRRCSREI